MSEIRNLVVYVADGVRWDHHPDSIRNRGITFRTIAASLHTPTAIASILTGRYLPGHGIRGFTDRIAPDQETVLDGFPNRAISESPGNFNEIIYRNLLERYDRCPLDAVDEPFGWFMRDAGGHAPYDGFNERLQTNESVRSYLRANGGDQGRLRADYRAAIESSTKRFKRFVLDPLTERGIRENTLIVYISDHGQLLGEYGHVGESYPACPEIVYVPATLIHPSLNAERRNDLFRHVDLAPTLSSLLDRDPILESADGVDVLADGPGEYGACLYDRPYPGIRGEFSYTISSLWDHDGGHVFVESGLWDKLRLTAGLLARIPAGIHVRRTRSLGSLKLLFENQRTWGDPGFSVEDAWRYLTTLRDSQRNGPNLSLTDETERNLQDLGYL